MAAVVLLITTDHPFHWETEKFEQHSKVNMTIVLEDRKIYAAFTIMYSAIVMRVSVT